MSLVTVQDETLEGDSYMETTTIRVGDASGVCLLESRVPIIMVATSVRCKMCSGTRTGRKLGKRSSHRKSPFLFDKDDEKHIRSIRTGSSIEL